jgi:ATP-dependent protease HslVU (ClpYQ) peptidase subunit
MSIVAIRVTPEMIVIGSDSIRVRRFTQEKLPFAKLKEINGMIIGSCGQAYESSLLFLFGKTRSPVTSSEHDIVEYLSEFQDWARKKMGEGSYKLSNQYILVFDQKAFRINNFLVHQITDFAAIGAGADYALTALYLGHTVEKAIEAACELSIYCEKPINIIEKKLLNV